MIPKALVLDFGGVVIKTPFEIMEPLERRIGVAPDTLGWRGPFSPADDELWRKMQRHDITERDYWALRAEEAGRAAAAPFPWSTRDLMVALYRGPEEEFVRPEAVEAIAAARAGGVRVAVLTNDLAAFHGEDWYYALTISKWIEHLVDASITGVLKPDPGSYARVVAELDLAPGDALFVDDQPRNVEGAKRAGMQTLAFDVTRPAESFDIALAKFGLGREQVAP